MAMRGNNYSPELLVQFVKMSIDEYKTWCNWEQNIKSLYVAFFFFVCSFMFYKHHFHLLLLIFNACSEFSDTLYYQNYGKHL